MGYSKVLAGAAAAIAFAGIGAVQAQDVREFSFGYDQPHSTGYGFAADVFGEKLAELHERRADHRALRPAEQHHHPCSAIKHGVQTAVDAN